MLLKNATVVAAEMATEDFSNLTSARASEILDAFATIVELSCKATALLGGVDKLPTKEAADVVVNTGLVKTLLAARKSAKITLPNNLVGAVVRLANGPLQNIGDSFVVENSNVAITLSVVEKAKDEWDSEEIVKDAGMTVAAEFVNEGLKDCFKAPVCAINPTACNRAILDGRLDASRKTVSKSLDIAVSFSYKDKKEE